MKWSILILAALIGCSDQVEDQKVEIEKSVSQSSLLTREALEGKHFLEDGSVYEGELVRGKPHGYGKIKFKNDDFYEGQFKEGMAHGHGTIRYKSDVNLEKYVGAWKGGKREGFGTLYFIDSSQMVGAWNSDALVYGEFQKADGTIISGRWKGRIVTEGNLRDGLGNQFSGIFDDQNGYKQGHLKVVNGDQYTGSFQSERYHGKGLLSKADGSYYVGEFASGLYQGTGILVLSDGTKYAGEFIENKPHGYGIQTNLNGINYSGLWEDGLKNGTGTLDFGDGSSYVGEFRNGLAFEGYYDWGDGRITESYQNEEGEWVDR